MWRNNSFGLHVHVGIKGADRAIADGRPAHVPAGASARVLGQPGRSWRASSSTSTRPARRSSPACSALRIPDSFGDWDTYERYVRFLYETGLIIEHTQLWWSVRPHLAFPTVEIRIADGQPDLAEAQSLAALMFARPHARARIDEAGAAATPSASPPRRRTSGGRSARGSPGTSSTSTPATCAQPGRRPSNTGVDAAGRRRVGSTSFLTVPSISAAERQISRHEAGETLEEIYAQEILSPYVSEQDAELEQEQLASASWPRSCGSRVEDVFREHARPRLDDRLPAPGADRGLRRRARPRPEPPGPSRRCRRSSRCSAGSFRRMSSAASRSRSPTFNSPTSRPQRETDGS